MVNCKTPAYGMILRDAVGKNVLRLYFDMLPFFNPFIALSTQVSAIGFIVVAIFLAIIVIHFINLHVFLHTP